LVLQELQDKEAVEETHWLILVLQPAVVVEELEDQEQIKRSLTTVLHQEV
jgi:hypothetical protein